MENKIIWNFLNVQVACVFPNDHLKIPLHKQCYKQSLWGPSRIKSCFRMCNAMAHFILRGTELLEPVTPMGSGY